jgi:hypothetical protein
LGRDTGRRDKHLAKDFKSVRTVACGYCAEIPYDTALCIQIRRHNDEAAAAPVLFSDTFKHATIDEPRNKAPQRLRPEPLEAEKLDEAVGLKELGCIAHCEHLL